MTRAARSTTPKSKSAIPGSCWPTSTRSWLVADQFYGDRVSGIEDPFGYRWFIATHKEDLTMNEIRRRAAAQRD
jgi:hypothetical protein